MNLASSYPSVLLQTRLRIPPSRSGMLPRWDLQKALEEGLQQEIKLILVCAPAGSGKTSLVISWINEVQKRGKTKIGWLRLEESENTPFRFWRYFIAALQTIHPEIGETVHKLIQAEPNLPAESFLPVLINDLAAQPFSMLLVLDDFHYIQDVSIQTGLAYLIEHQPENVHLLLSTRSDPFFPLARLRARHQIVELRYQEVRFSQAETSAFLRETMSLGLTDEQVGELYDRTEGWAAGLQLAALTIKEQADPEKVIRQYNSQDRYLIDYFTNEILDQLPEERRDFLLQTAILDSLCGAICDDMLERTGSAALLVQLDRNNIFIAPLDHTRTWYRYHPLFADLLRRRLAQAYPEREVFRLHERASNWFAANQMPDAAIQHALAAQAYALAWKMVREEGISRILRGDAQIALNWCRSFPETWNTGRLERLILTAWALLATARFLETKAIIEQMGSLMPQVGQASGLKDQPGPAGQATIDPDVCGQAFALRATMSFNLGQTDACIGDARQALAFLAPENRVIRSIVALDLADAICVNGDFEAAKGAYQEAFEAAFAAQNPLIAINARAMFGRILAWQGRLTEARQTFEEVFRFAKDLGLEALPVVGLAEEGLADVAYEQNDLETARRWVMKSLKRFQQWGHARHRTNSALLLALLDIQAGDWDAARKTLEDLSAVAHSQPVGRLSGAIDTAKAHLYLAAGDLHHARSALLQARLLRDAPAEGEPVFCLPVRIHPFSASRYPVLGQYFYQSGDPVAALQALHSQIQLAEHSEYQSMVIRALVLKARILNETGQPQPARDVMQRAIYLAQPEGHIQAFVSGGETVRQLVQACRSPLKDTPEEASFIDHLLASFPNRRTDSQPIPPNLSLAANKTKPAAPNPLSEREGAVLRLAAAGLTNDEIARELIVSTNTIKTHFKRVFDKLGVNSRREAITIAGQNDWLN